MADQDILIQIRTALESGGVDAAKTKLKELTVEQKAASAASAGQNQANQELQRSMGQSKKVLEGLNQTTLGGATAGKGMLQVIEGLTGSFPKMSAAIGSVGAVMGVAFTAWQVGLKVQEALWNKLVPSINNVGTTARKTQADFEDLNKQKLEGLQKEIQTILDALNKTISAIDEAERRAGAVRGAKKEKELAEAGKLEGTAADRTVAEIEKRYAEEELAAREKAAKERIIAAENAINKAEENLNLTRKQMAEDDALFERLRADSMANPNREGLRKLAIEAMNKTFANKKVYEKSLKEMQDQVDASEKTIADSQTELDVVDIGKTTVQSRYSATMSRADKEDQKKAKEKAAEEEKKKIEAQEKELQKQFEKDKEAKQVDIINAKSKTDYYKSLSDSKSYDKYDKLANEAEQLAQGEELALKRIEQAFKAATEKLKESARNVTEQAKNMDN